MSMKKWMKNIKMDTSLMISFIALLISGLAALFSYKQLTLSAGQIRAYVQVTEASLAEPLMEASYIKIRLRIKNFGQTAAIKISGNMDYSAIVPDITGKGNGANITDIGTMGPGMEKVVIITSNKINYRSFPEPRLGRSPQIYFYGTIWYTDATTNVRGHEDWTYQLTLKKPEDLNKTELEQSETLVFKSND
jgi:hypothetical protein